MAKDMQCQYCRFWELNSAQMKDAGEVTGLVFAPCKVGPPQMLDEIGEFAVWPRTGAGDWCGRFEKKPVT